MNYPKAKVYTDGSHFIAIPYAEQNWKKRKKTHSTKTNELNEKVEKTYKESSGSRKEKIKVTINEIDKEIGNIEKSTEIVMSNLARMTRNEIVRKTRLSRKVYLQKWDYFCTFTYDDNKLSEDEFKKKLSNCLKHLSSRKGWKYVGVWEKSPKNERLHFHGLFYIPQMIGELIEKKDYSTTKHKMQVATQNTFFLERFGRNDFKVIVKSELGQAIAYMVKYIQKTGEKIVYSKDLPTYFVSAITEQDIVCTIGQENRKLLLFDDFYCIIDDECMGRVSPEVIQKMPKSN